MPIPVPFVPGRKSPHPESTHPRMHATAVLRGVYTGNIPTVVNWHSGLTFPMDLNDQLGDCTIADEAHGVGAFTGFGQGTEVVLSNTDVLKVYERVGGYIPGNPSTDQGCVIQDVLNDWRKTGIGTPPHQILAFFQVDHTNIDQMKACVWLFLGVTLGVNLPQSAMDQFNTGKPWDYDPHANNTILGGHDVRVIGYNTNGTFDVLTWGGVQKVTWVWMQHYAEEAWAEADAEVVKNNAAPNGLSVTALNTAFTQVTGKPGPFPATPPAPTPVPPGPTPGPTPAPTPATDPLDGQLIKDLGSWPSDTHVGANAKAANSINKWRQAKHL